MGRLTTIEELENRVPAPEPAPEAQSAPEQPAIDAEPKAANKPSASMDARSEYDFHGLDDEEPEPLAVGHKVLLAVGACAFIAVVVYICNYWFHFI